eukprot:1146539-Pelagomonas_calceolata.AAC.13
MCAAPVVLQLRMNRQHQFSMHTGKLQGFEKEEPQLDCPALPCLPLNVLIVNVFCCCCAAT